jgi:hypothetical protein
LFDLLTSITAAEPSLFTWARIGTLDLQHSDPQSPDYDGSKPRPTAVKLARLLDQCQGLTHLDLSGDRDDNRSIFISDVEVEPLACALERCSALVSLKLRENGLYDRGVKWPAGALGQLTALRYLNLRDNNSRDDDDVYIGITDESAKMLSKLLELGQFPAQTSEVTEGERGCERPGGWRVRRATIGRGTACC